MLYPKRPKSTQALPFGPAALLVTTSRPSNGTLTGESRLARSYVPGAMVAQPEPYRQLVRERDANHYGGESGLWSSWFVPMRHSTVSDGANYILNYHGSVGTGVLEPGSYRKGSSRP